MCMGNRADSQSISKCAGEIIDRCLPPPSVINDTTIYMPLNPLELYLRCCGGYRLDRGATLTCLA